jgi:photosystem II stability/assembly factor-like uncharacterized protein
VNGTLWVASGDGLFWLRREADGWAVAGRALEGLGLTSVDAAYGVVLAGGVDGVLRSLDGGETWETADRGVTVRHVRWVALHQEVAGLALLGTEPAAIYRSEDHGASWTNCPEVETLRAKGGWWLPYSPESGCIRGLAFHGQRAYAAAEVGGVLRSDDAGRSWRRVEGSPESAEFETPPQGQVHPDVHSIATHPASPDSVFAPTGGGFFTSRDGGKTWQRRHDGYCRAVWVDPTDADHMILGPADDVDRNGRIEETRDGGATWQPASAGLKAPWRRHMVERFAPAASELLAVLSNGQVFSAPLGALEWRPALREVPDVRALAYAA